MLHNGWMPLRTAVKRHTLLWHISQYRPTYFFFFFFFPSHIVKCAAFRLRFAWWFLPFTVGSASSFNFFFYWHLTSNLRVCLFFQDSPFGHYPRRATLCTLVNRSVSSRADGYSEQLVSGITLRFSTPLTNNCITSFSCTLEDLWNISIEIRSVGLSWIAP